MNNNSGFADLLNTSYAETDSLTVTNLILPNLDQNSIPYIDTDNIVQDLVLTNGQLIVGRSGHSPVANTLTGTTNQVNITNGSGSITLSTPQDIAPSSTPTFNAIQTYTNNVNIGNTTSLLGTTDNSVVIGRLANTNNAILGVAVGARFSN